MLLEVDFAPFYTFSYIRFHSCRTGGKAVLVAAAAPPAAMCTLLCIRCGKDSVYSSEIFTAGTILSVISLPLVIEFTEFLTKMIS